MKPLTYNFHKKDRFTGELRYLDGRYVLTIDCAKDLTAEELSTLDTVWQTMTGLMDRRGQHTDDDWSAIRREAEAMDERERKSH